MTLNVKDAAGTTVPLKSTTDTGEEVPNHIVDTGSGAGATIGTAADAAVSTDTTGTLSAKLRGLVKIFADVLGLAADAAVTTNTTGTISGKLRGVVAHLVTIVTYLTDIDNILNSSVPVTHLSSIAGGTTRYHAVSAASNNAVLIKGSVGTVYGWNIYNNAAYPIYVKLYNATTNPPVPGTTAISKVIGVPAGGGSNFWGASGMAFSTGIGLAILKDITDAGTTAVALSDCTVDIEYK